MSELVKIKLNVTPAEIVKILKNHDKCVGNKIMPIADNVLITVEEEAIRFTTTNGNNFVRTVIPNHNGKTAKVLIPYKKLVDLLKLLTNQPLVVFINEESFQIKIKAQEGSYEISGENPEDFPVFPDSLTNDKKIEWFSASALAFKASIENVIYAVSTDELRPSMTGVYFEANGSVTMTATDGNVLAHSKIVDEFRVERENNEIIRAEILDAVLKIIPDKKEITLYSNSRYQWMIMGDVELCAIKIDERYPDWKNAVPKDNNTVKIDRRNLLASINRMLLFTDKATSVVKAEVNLKSISLTADNHDYDHHGHERITLESEAPEMLKIGLNASKLKDVLGNINQEFLKLEYSTANRAVIFRYEEGFSLLMPIALMDAIYN